MKPFPRTFMATLLLSSAALVAAQSSVVIPALPPGSTTPAPAPAPLTPVVNPIAPAPTTTAPTTTPVVTPAPTVTTLPAKYPLLTIAHTAQLSGPRVIRAGTASTWSVQVTNKGTQAIDLSYGACDVRFEVLNAAGEVVRPDPKDTLCTMQLVMANIGPGETKELQKIRWDGKDAHGNNVPKGTYTIRSVFNGSGVMIRPVDYKVTVF